MDLSHEETQLYQVNSVFQINSGKISESFISRNLLRRSEPKYKIKSNQIIESAIWINPSPPSESWKRKNLQIEVNYRHKEIYLVKVNQNSSRNPKEKSESHYLRNLQGGNESFRLINTVIESEPRYQRNPNAQSEPFLI